MPTLALPAGVLHYRDDGAAAAHAGAPLVLLSANPGDSRDFDAIVPALARRRRVLRLDWPGYGGSAAPVPPESAGAGLLLDIFTRWMDALALPRAHLAGNSVGGNVAVHYALAQPARVASLTLISPGGFTAHNALTRLFCRAQGVPALNRALARLFVRGYLRRRNDWTRAMIARSDGEQSAPAARAVNAAVWRSFLDPAHDLREAARALRLPTLLMNGRHDPVIPARTDGRNAAAAMPQAQALVFDCGHAPFAELPEDFLAALEPFLEQADAAR